MKDHMISMEMDKYVTKLKQCLYNITCIKK